MSITSAKRTPLSEAQIQAHLASLPGWTWQPGDSFIERRFSFARYAQTLAFVNAVAQLAEQADHHPEMVVRYSQCWVRFSTHEPPGISALDFSCALAVQALHLP